MTNPHEIRAMVLAWLRGSQPGLVALALVTGAGAGLGAIVFRYLIFWFTQIFTGFTDYSAVGHVANPHLLWLGPFFVILAPAVAGLIYGPLIWRFAPEARGHGVPEVMFAVTERGGRIAPQVAVVKSLASALCIGGGGSVGREGPIVQIGSALGSTLGQILHLPVTRLRLLVACGAAGGISATFNAPIAGVLFGMELILRDFETQSFGVVVLSSVTATVIGRAAFGSHAFLVLPAFHIVHLWEYLFYAILGLLAGGVGMGFTKILYGIEDLCDAIWHGPEWLRPAAGGLVLGLLLLALPELYGVGYPVLENAVRGHYALLLLLLLLVGKMVATSLTIGIGGSGGVFAPSLFIGAMFGTAYGVILGHLLPGYTASPGAYGLVGMGAVFAGATRAPMTGIVIIFELTGDYTIILPLMCAIVLSTAVSALISPDTIYTLKLRRRGIDILRGRGANLMQVLTAAQALEPLPEAIPASTRVGGLLQRFSIAGRDVLPVVKSSQESSRYQGVITAQEVEEALRENNLATTAADLALPVEPCLDTQTLEQALGALVRSTLSGLPVVRADGTLAGWITHQGVLRAYHMRLQESVQRAQARGSAGPAPAPSSPVSPPAAAPVVEGAPAHAPEHEAPAAASLSAPDPGTVLDHQLEGYRIVEHAVAPGAAIAGRQVMEVPWPPSALLLTVRRRGDLFTPRGSTELRGGDQLSVLVRDTQVQDLQQALAGTVVQEAASAAAGSSDAASSDPAPSPAPEEA